MVVDSSDCTNVIRVLQKFLEAVGTFDIKAGIPNFDQNPYDWRVDKYEPQRRASSLIDSFRTMCFFL